MQKPAPGSRLRPRLIAPIAAVCLLIALALPSAPRADAAADGPEPSWQHDVELTLRPAAAPSPVLRYRLLPPAIDRRPGNAAEVYMEAAAMLEELELPDRRAVDDALDMTLEQLRQDPPRELIEPITPALDKIEQGARRDNCAWERPIREEGMFMELPELGPFRQMAHLLVLRARIAVAEGRLDDAWHDYQTVMALGRHISQGQTLIEGLVGTAMAWLLADEFDLFIQQTGAPNLYWSLSILPAPLIDLRNAYDFEEGWFYWTLAGPDVEPLRRAELDRAAFVRLVHQLLGRERVWHRADRPDAAADEVDLATAVGIVLLDYPHARRWLIEQGMDEGELDRMDSHEVVVRYHVGLWEQSRDAVFKWAYLPAGEIHLRQVNEDSDAIFDRLRREHPTSFAGMLLPALESVGRASMRMDRRIAILRNVEAVRLYAAEHGSAPAGLDDITAVPVPPDPVTGRPFDYQREGDTATIATAPDEQDPFGFTLRYVINLDR